MSKHHTPILPSQEELDYLRKYTYNTILGKVYSDGIEVGHKNNHGYYVISGKIRHDNGSRKKHLRHHVIWWIHYGSWPSNLLDHDDGNITNDAIGNLVLSTVRNNNANTPRK